MKHEGGQPSVKDPSLPPFEAWWRLTGRGRIWASLAIVLLLLAATAVVYLSGGTRQPLTHLMYLPVFFAAAVFELRGALLVALIAGLLVGPWMPVDVQAAEMQEVGGWLSRTGFFLLFGAIAGHTVHVLNARLDAVQAMVERLGTTYARVLASFADTVEARDEQTSGHSARVAYNACLMGKALELDDRAMETLYWAGLLHDLGKIAVPEHILQKPGRLTEAEYEVIKRHAGYGADLLERASPDFRDIALAIRHHHERWDGTGYPDGLAAEAIPLLGRVLAVVDVFEALTSERPYRQPVSPAQALAYIKDNAGSHFDPQLVVVFEALALRENLYLAQDKPVVEEFVRPARFHEAIREARPGVMKPSPYRGLLLRRHS